MYVVLYRAGIRCQRARVPNAPPNVRATRTDVATDSRLPPNTQGPGPHETTATSRLHSPQRSAKERLVPWWEAIPLPGRERNRERTTALPQSDPGDCAIRPDEAGAKHRTKQGGGR